MSRLTNPVLFFNDTIGRTLPEATLDFYDTGTFDRKETYTDPELTEANPNPVVADGAGRFPNIFLGGGGYRAVLSDKEGVEVWTRDNVENYATADDVAGQAIIDIAGDQDIELTPGQAVASTLIFSPVSGPTTGDISISTPTDTARTWLVINNDTGGNTITFKTATGTGVDLLGGGRQYLVRSDGTDMVLVATIDPRLSWQDVSGSNSTGVEYTNNNDYVISVIIQAINTSGNLSRVLVTLDGTYTFGNTSDASGVSSRAVVSFNVPPGGTYEIDTEAGAILGSISLWLEMK